MLCSRILLEIWDIGSWETAKLTPWWCDGVALLHIWWGIKCDDGYRDSLERIPFLGEPFHCVDLWSRNIWLSDNCPPIRMESIWGTFECTYFDCVVKSGAQSSRHNHLLCQFSTFCDADVYQPGLFMWTLASPIDPRIHWADNHPRGPSFKTLKLYSGTSIWTLII